MQIDGMIAEAVMGEDVGGKGCCLAYCNLIIFLLAGREEMVNRLLHTNKRQRTEVLRLLKSF